MYNMIPSDELGELKCSDLDVPLFTTESFRPALSSHLNDITNDQWMLLSDGRIDTDTSILLSDMCHDLLHLISSVILVAASPQVQSRMCEQTVREADRNPDNKDRNYKSVTKEDVQASLGDALYCCVCEEMGVPHEKTDSSDRLLELVAEVVKIRVNRSLDILRWSFSPTHSVESPDSPDASHTEEMINSMAEILGDLIRMESSEDLGSLDSDSFEDSPSDEVTSVEELSEDEETVCSSEDQDCVDETTDVEETSDDEETVCSPEGQGRVDEVMEVEELPAVDAETVCSQSKRQSDLSCGQSVERSATSAEALLQRDNTFLTVFLMKLTDHIAHSTKTSIFDVNLDGMLRCLRKTTVEGSSALPQSVGNIHISIYKELCDQFGSAKLLQTAMVSSDVAFEEAVGRALKAQLHKSSRKTNSFATKIRRFFGRRTSKVTPACETNTSASHSEVIGLENGSTPPPPPPPPQREQQRPAIRRMFLSAARILRKPFTFCICAGSQD